MGLTIKHIDLGGVNCYLGCQAGKYVLFDTGGYMILDKSFNNRRDLLLKALKNNNCTKENLKLLILTHGDVDHVANAAYLKKQFGLKIAMHKGDLNLVQNPKLEDMMASFNYRSALLKFVMKCMKKKVNLVMEKTANSFESFIPDIYLEEGDSLETFGFDAKILALPGHTPGSIGVLTGKNELIAGDLFQNNKKLGPAINAIDFEALDKSIKRIENMKVNRIYVGHGIPWKRD